MLKLIPNLPDGVIGLTALGQVTANDYETVLMPEVESRLKRHSQIRILYHLGPEFTGFDFGAMWDDLKLGLAHFDAWEKIAIVTDEKWIKTTTDIFKFAIPCQVMFFENRQYTEAEIWIVD